MKIKKILAMLLAAIMLLGLVACGGEDTQADGEICTITVTVVHKDGSVREFKYKTDQEFLGPVLLEDGLIEGKEGPYGLTISVVDGEKAVYEEDGAYWALYEGEEYAVQGIDTTPVVDGGEYKLEYTPA